MILVPGKYEAVNESIENIQSLSAIREMRTTVSIWILKLPSLLAYLPVDLDMVEHLRPDPIFPGTTFMQHHLMGGKNASGYAIVAVMLVGVGVVMAAVHLCVTKAAKMQQPQMPFSMSSTLFLISFLECLIYWPSQVPRILVVTRVPCGTEKNQKPPKCSKKCPISRLCRHKLQSRPHKCHYGACPPCRLVCGEEFSCGHSCKERCHGPIPPPNPEFTLKPKKKKMGRVIEATPGSTCPPCKEIVLVSCFGQHLGQERPMVCVSKRQFSCENLCGNPLPCGNHYCTKACHVLETQMGSTYAEPCEDCTLRCQKDRPTWCSHSCPLPCHVGNCPPCKALVKRSCHCGSMKHVFECLYYNTLTAEEQLRVRTCSGPCHRKLPNCPHLCSEICHPGQCPTIDLCTKKVTVRCSCNTLKKELICQDVLKTYKNLGRDPKDVSKSHFGVGLLPCGANCKKEVQKDESELHLRKTHESNEPGVKPVNAPKRRRRRERGKEMRQTSKFEAIKAISMRCLWVMLMILVFIMCAYWCYKGIFWLSDWMNEVDEQRLRKMSPRDILGFYVRSSPLIFFGDDKITILMNHYFADNKAQLFVYRAHNGKFWVIIDRQMGPNNGPKAIVYKRLDMVLIAHSRTRNTLS
ncbi:NF-X1-type zinc finger protein NFXL2 [Carex littledalei]|uniref:NF-X1-type zinc finger protein NFXL2 n=1 Tax=Carex littledalei TaxID=544730 RepID=A0A833QTC3_9POAL|nr:NF-X1-type zinc finger protein NFXL2 [Carex littledalei]